ncbi:hypothetical protein NQ318_007678 [Aromia moschata]|uniref:Uncharacterized protein n=1 Tax=Aromia moschata TaxID=1265417 RepID=A0AAV8XLZ4_9CUCU|nr:hypothetical protein NQ318_007678 [Aromia moschata]
MDDTTDVNVVIGGLDEAKAMEEHLIASRTFKTLAGIKKTRTKETELVRYLGIKSVRLQEAVNSNVLESRDEQRNQSTQLFTAPLKADIFEPVALYSVKSEFGLLSSRLLGGHADSVKPNSDLRVSLYNTAIIGD